ncbi:MAG TPA: DUF362 domain-containing protein [Aggregatilineaceae bacterium]|nr:DUF362 domain-containing protein [Aggregatilineaceae bacterium]
MTHAHALSRRDFLKTAGALAGRVLIPDLLPGRVTPVSRWAGPAPKVALAQATGYERVAIRAQVQAMLDALGSLGDLVHRGDYVAIKPNLTGGTWWQTQIHVPAVDSMVTHPEVVRALAEAVLDAGAARLYIVEAVFDGPSFTLWGYQDLADDLGATLIDLNGPSPAKSFVTQSVGDDGLIYDTFTVNPILTEVDVFMSAAKLKCHASAGVTLSMKNLVGMVPVPRYDLGHNGNRSALHGRGQEYRTRLPRVIVDLNRARRIDFALIDGVKTSEGGEGPWIDGWTPLEAGVLVAGKNPVATDAVAAAVMGFDPAAESLVETPFLFCENHLRLASEAGLGPYCLDEIEIVGAALEDVRREFRPYGGAGQD